MINILFLNEGKEVDYLCDCVYHGLCTNSNLYIETITDYWFIYTGNTADSLKTRYGKGFTITNRVPINKKHNISKNEALNKIKNHFYDIVIYGSFLNYRPFLKEVLLNYKKNEVIFIDGGDSEFYRISWLHPRSKYIELKQRNFTKKYAKLGTYFKRELDSRIKCCYPISFAIPEENIVDTIPIKEIRDAFVYPGRHETYIFDNEFDYNHGYQIAKFGTTIKKAGWDCMRHYEILANGTIPYFPDIEKCPTSTMVNFPKSIIMLTNKLYESGDFNDEEYNYYANILLNYTKNFLTTKILGEYVLSLTNRK